MNRGHHSGRSHFRPRGSRLMTSTSMICYYNFPRKRRPPKRSMSRQIFLAYLDPTSANLNIQLSSYLRAPVPIPFRDIILSITTKNLIPHWKEPNESNLTPLCHWMCKLRYCALIYIFNLVFRDAFSCSAFKKLFTVLHVIVLLHSTTSNGLYMFPCLQNPP